MGVWSNFIQNPAEDRIAASQWLLLDVIAMSKEGITTEEIYNRLVKELIRIKKNRPSFFIMWSFGYCLSDMLSVQEEFGFIAKKPSGVIQWEITSKGLNLIEETKSYVQSVIGKPSTF